MVPRLRGEVLWEPDHYGARRRYQCTLRVLQQPLAEDALVRPMLVEDNELVPLLGRIMSVRRRKELLERLNALDTGTTEDACRAEREARMRKAIQIEETLKWGRISADSL